MKKIALLLAVLLTLALLLPAAVAEEQVREELPVYVWFGDAGFDLEAALAQVPDMETMKKKEGKSWEGPSSQHTFYKEDGAVGYVWYSDDGSVEAVTLRCYLNDAYEALRKTTRSSDNQLRVYYPTGVITLNVWENPEMAQTLQVKYTRSGRMRNYIYRPAENVELTFNALGECLNEPEELAEVAAKYGLPKLVGDASDLTGVSFAPNVKVYEAFQDLGIDVKALIAAAPGPGEEPVTDEQGNTISILLDARGAARYVMVEFAAPVDGFWTRLLIPRQVNWMLELGRDAYSASYYQDGTLDCYGYPDALGIGINFDADGTMWDSPTDGESMIPAYPPLEIIPASRDYSDEPVLRASDMPERVAPAVYATLAAFPRDLSAFTGRLPELVLTEEGEGRYLVRDEGYDMLKLCYMEDGEQVEFKGRLDGQTWVIDAPDVPWEQVSVWFSAEVMLGDEGFAEYMWDDPGTGVMCEAFFFEPDENGYEFIQVRNEYRGTSRISLFADDVVARYDLDGRLTQYEYCDNKGEWTTYEADDPDGPLEIIGE